MEREREEKETEQKGRMIEIILHNIHEFKLWLP